MRGGVIFETNSIFEYKPSPHFRLDVVYKIGGGGGGGGGVLTGHYGNCPFGKYTSHKVKKFVEPPLISHSLTFCSLSRNQIKDEGVRALYEALQVNQGLQKLK